MKKQKKENGITLIALIITIILLIILATVSVRIITDTGLIGRTQEGIIATEKAEVDEDIQLVIANADVKYYAEGLASKREAYTQELFDKIVRGEVINLKKTNEKITGVVEKSGGRKYNFEIPITDDSNKEPYFLYSIESDAYQDFWTGELTESFYLVVEPNLENNFFYASDGEELEEVVEISFDNQTIEIYPGDTGEFEVTTARYIRY